MEALFASDLAAKRGLGEHRKAMIRHELAVWHCTEPHPDADLLQLCLRLIEQEEEWQRLWDACEEDGSKPDADRAFEEFSASAWPGNASNPDDLPAQLIAARPVSLAGLREMARAAMALEAAPAWLDARRDDMDDILLAVVRGAAGVERMPIGDGSQPK